MFKENEKSVGTASELAYAKAESAPARATDADLKKERRFCSGIGWCFFAIVIVLTALQNAVPMLVFHYAPEFYLRHDDVVYALAILSIYAAGYPLLALLCRRRERVQIKKRKRMGAANFLVLLMMCFGVALLGSLLGEMVNAAIGAIQGSAVANPVEEAFSENSVWISFVFTGICAPVVEELVFRKILVDRLARYGEAAAVVMSGLMFGLIHGNFSQFFYAVFLGMLFAYVYAKTGRIGYTIALHLIINLSSSLMALVVMRENASASAISTACEVLLYGLDLAGIILLMVKRKKFVFEKGMVQLPKGKRASVLWGNAGMMAYTLVCMALFGIMLIWA